MREKNGREFVILYEKFYVQYLYYESITCIHALRRVHKYAQGWQGKKQIRRHLLSMKITFERVEKEGRATNPTVVQPR